ncbi:hypothetical protein Q8X48_12925 [Pseudomonas sp. QLc11A]|uniref:Uncharacterized protein n=1 Tax=Pseudomonas azerbaijanorientalis TaxID=2842350 RepID=A0ABW8W2Q0_9PSED
MYFELGTKGLNGRNESWWSLSYVEAEDQFYWRHRWSNMSGLTVHDGEKRLPILEAKGESYYSDAVKVIREKFPTWKNIDQL